MKKKIAIDSFTVRRFKGKYTRIQNGLMVGNSYRFCPNHPGRRTRGDRALIILIDSLYVP